MVILICSISLTYPTTQIGDYIKYQGKIYDFYEPKITNSIRVYFNIYFSQSSDCWRGYRSLWEIKGNNIYFKQILNKETVFIDNHFKKDTFSRRFLTAIVNIFNPQIWNYQIKAYTGELKITEAKKYGEINAYNLNIRDGIIINVEDCSYLNKSEYRDILRMVYKQYSNANYHEAYKNQSFTGVSSIL